MANSATTRRLALRMRPDLLVQPQQIGGHRYWAIKDPLALTYFHLRDEEHAILRMLDGQTSLSQIKRRFEEAFAPLKITVEQIQAFLGRLHESGLLLADTPGQGEELLRRHRQRWWRTRLQSLIGILAFRLWSFDAEPVLRRLYPKCRWLFSPWSLAGGVLLVLAAATLVAVESEAMRAELPGFRAFFSLRNVVWLAVALAVTKVLHELGHALSCKHFGGECHELGVMLLVFTPCLYCNVSDSWMLPSKWRRIAITAAGMCVELVLAAACTFLWWFSQPGLLHTLCLNTMFVCSVSTLVLNGNPLLRYDGYFILSDLVDVPNLAQQSRALVRRWLARVCLGLESPQDRDLPERHRALLAAYAVASTLYRWAVVVGILWFCFRVVEPYRLDLLAEALTVVVFAGILAMPVANTVAFVRNPTQTRRIKRTRLLWTCGAVLAAAAGLWIVPLPFRVAAPVVLQAGGADHVYVSVPGTLLEALPAGAVVGPGGMLARLENRELQMQVEELTGRCNQQRLHLENLQYRLLEDPGVGPQIPAAKEALADVEERLRRRQRDLEQLTLTAPAGGTVLPPADVAGHPAAPGQLQRWSGSPLDPRNRGCYLETGTLLCLVGDPSHLEAVLFVDQADLRFVSTGQRVEVQLDELPGEVLRGTIAEIAKADLKVVPRELAAGDSLPERIGRQGIAAGLETSYQARVRLDDHERVLLAGSRGRAKIAADPQPLGQRLYRYLRRTFSFKL